MFFCSLVAINAAVIGYIVTVCDFTLAVLVA